MSKPTFLDLPPEIRNRIYFFLGDLVPTHHAAVIGRDVQNGRIVVYCACKGCLPRVAQPAIAKICRVVRNETLPIFYGANDWRLGGSCIDWLHKIERHLHLFGAVTGFARAVAVVEKTKAEAEKARQDK